MLYDFDYPDTKYNPFHHPAGTPGSIGGQFAPADGRGGGGSRRATEDGIDALVEVESSIQQEKVTDKIKQGIAALPAKMRERIASLRANRSDDTPPFVIAQSLGPDQAGAYGVYFGHNDQIRFDQTTMTGLTQEHINRIVAHEVSHMLDNRYISDNSRSDAYFNKVSRKMKLTPAEKKYYNYFSSLAPEAWAEAGAQVITGGNFVNIYGPGENLPNDVRPFTEAFKPAISFVRAQYKDAGLI